MGQGRPKDDRTASLAAQKPAERDLSSLKAGKKPLFERYLQMDEKQKGEAEVCSFRAGTFKAYKDLIKLRRSSDAFTATSPVTASTAAVVRATSVPPFQGIRG